MILNLSPATGLVKSILGAKVRDESLGEPVAMFINYADAADPENYGKELVERIIIEGYMLALADGKRTFDNRGNARLEVPLKLGNRDFASYLLDLRISPDKKVSDVLLCTSMVSKKDVVQKILEMGLFHIKLSVEN